MATNEILPFASTNTGTNLLTQAEYAADAQRVIGHQPGIARSKLENKALRQASLMAAGLAEFIADYQSNNVTDSLTAQQVADYLLTAITSNIPIADSTKRGIIETATAAEVQAGIDGDRAVTPSGLNSFPRLFSNNGYYRLPGGFLIQWGYYSGGVHNPSITFPIAFPVASLSIIAVATDDNNTVATQTGPGPRFGFDPSQIDAVTGVNSAAGFMYLALGY